MGGYEPFEAVAYWLFFIRRYGRRVGEAYYHYDRDYFAPGQDQQRVEFAEAIVSAFEVGDHQEKVRAVAALLDAMEQRDYSVREEAKLPGRDGAI